MGFTPSEYQQAIYDFVENEKGNAVVEAVAGSGKTTTIVEATNRIPKGKRAIFVAFNKSIATELSKKLPKRVNARTLHSLGYSMFYGNVPGKPNVDTNKLSDIVNEVMKTVPYLDYTERDEMKTFFMKIIPKIKATLSDTDKESIAQLADYYNIFAFVNEQKVNLIKEILNRCLADTRRIDFDDMIWIPIMLGFKSRTYDWIFVDESQDLNKSQFELIKMITNGNTRIVAVGDSRQSIYGFRGADSNSMDNFREEFNATELPLSITYRCPKKVVSLAQTIVKNIEACDTAEDGIVERVNRDSMLQKVEDGNLILCRTNAPLVKVAFELIKQRKKVVILGKDIGKNLIKTVDRQKAYDINDLISKISKYERYQQELLQMIANGEYNPKYKSRVMNAIDSCSVIITVAQEVNTVHEVKSVIAEIFSDKKNGIICSSVHKAKGLENNRVFIYGYDELMPHPMAETTEEVEQEYNVKYVAITRAKKELYLVNDDALLY